MALRCSYPGCTYEIEAGTNPVVAGPLLQGHVLGHSQVCRAKPASVRRPEISTGGTTEGWHYFLIRWRAYVQAVRLPAEDIPIQLLECLDPNLRRDVTRNMVGPTPVEGHSEAELLAAIRALAVREENPKVARVALSRMVQDRGESVRSFAARLRGQAEVCRFTMKCTGCAVINSQGEHRVADQLCIGLADPDIQEDLLKDPNQEMTVEETIRFVEVRAAGKRSAVTISTPPTTNTSTEEVDQEDAIPSGYKKQQRPPAKATHPKSTPPKSNRPQTPAHNQPHQNKWQQPPQKPASPLANPKARCGFCGNQGHGERARTAIRRNQCPAYGTLCTSCGKPNHYAQYCWQGMEQESAIHENLSTMQEGSLPHQTWDSNRRLWVKRRSPPQPNLNVTVSLHTADYRAHGHTLRREKHNLPTTALADTGCQSCLAGPLLLQGLGLNNNDLIPACLTMKSASGNPLPILGASLLRIKFKQEESRQMVYFSPLASKLYLSLATCQDLGLIAPAFPLVAATVNSKETPPPATGIQTTTTSDPLTPPVPRRVPQSPRPQDHPPMSGPHPQPTANPHPTVPAARPGPKSPPTARPTPTATPHRPCSCPTRAPPPDRPTTLPFPGTPENRHKLERHLLDLYAASAFNVCEHQPLPLMSGPPLTLSIDQTAIPKPCHTPISVPIHWQEEVKAGLDRDVRLGVLEKVPLGTPVTWCHRMVICTKKDGSLRRTINLQPLNRHATRETHHCQSPFHQARAVPRQTKKTVLDAWNGYHSVALAEDDRHYTTFITPWGRYRYRTAPQGYVASGDAYTARYDALVSHVMSKTKCIDDVLLWSEDITEAFHQAVEWLDICAVNGITLTPKKFRFAEDTVEFAGFSISPTEVRPADKYLQSIMEFPTPTSITDIRSWFGLVNQVAYTFAMTAAMQPFRALLKPATPFHWTDKLAEAFHSSKVHICGQIRKGVEIFDKNRPTCLTTDWSKEGIGFWLLQKHCHCPSGEPFCCPDGWRITLVGSRFTHAAESRYAPVEGEALAVADALERTRHFVLGCSDLVVAVDHKPLLKLFGDRCLEDIANPRLRNLKEKTLRYRFRMSYVPGARNHTSDALSRHPTGPSPQKLHLPDDQASPNPNCPGTPAGTTDSTCSIQTADGLSLAICSAISSIPISWEQLQSATTADQTLQDLSFYVSEGIPSDRDTLPAGVRPYHPIMTDLSIVDDVICLGERVIIPTSLRQTCLNALHAAHQGITGMTARASSSIYWPGITADIASARNRCSACNSNAPSQAAMPPTTPEQPEYPFQHICADFFHHDGAAYLVLVDRYSGWPIVSPATNGATGLAHTLRDTFATFGIPSTLTTDGGPEFTSHTTRDLLNSWGVQHRITSAYHPHSNNRAETGVKTVKRMIAGNTGPNGSLQTSFYKALLAYRNGPSPDTQISPAQCLFGRPTRDVLPTIPSKLHQQSRGNKALKQRSQALDKRNSLANKRWEEHSRGLTPLHQGDHVFVQNQSGRHPTKWDKSGVVVEVKQYHQYGVRMDGNGHITIRNRQFLRRRPGQEAPPDNPLTRRLPISTPAAEPPTCPTALVPHHPPMPPLPHQGTPAHAILPAPQPYHQNTPMRVAPPTPDIPPPPAAAPPAPPTPTPTTTRSYASVAGTPAPPGLRHQSAPRTLQLTPAKIPSPPPAPRRGTRVRRQFQHYGHAL